MIFDPRRVWAWIPVSSGVFPPFDIHPSVIERGYAPIASTVRELRHRLGIAGAVIWLPDGRISGSAEFPADMAPRLRAAGLGYLVSATDRRGMARSFGPLIDGGTPLIAYKGAMHLSPAMTELRGVEWDDFERRV